MPRSQSLDGCKELKLKAWLGLHFWGLSLSQNLDDISALWPVDTPCWPLLCCQTWCPDCDLSASLRRILCDWFAQGIQHCLSVCRLLAELCPQSPFVRSVDIQPRVSVGVLTLNLPAPWLWERKVSVSTDNHLSFVTHLRFWLSRKNSV